MLPHKSLQPWVRLGGPTICSSRAPSSSGLGRRPFKPETRVRIPSGLLYIGQKFGCLIQSKVGPSVDSAPLLFPSEPPKPVFRFSTSCPAGATS